MSTRTKRISPDEFVAAVEAVKAENPAITITPQHYYKAEQAISDQPPVCYVCLLGAVYARHTGKLPKDLLAERQRRNKYEWYAALYDDDVDAELGITRVYDSGVSDGFFMATGQTPEHDEDTDCVGSPGYRAGVLDGFEAGLRLVEAGTVTPRGEPVRFNHAVGVIPV